MNPEPIIVLPPRIPVLRDSTETVLKLNVQEFNIYFKNIILPWREEYDIQIRCDYGGNYGTFWRLSKFPHDIDSFDLELVIYNEYGERIASKETVIELYDRKESDPPYNTIFLGDSMTFSQVYMEHIATNLHNIVFKGSRNRFGHISHEGRGGWRYQTYFTAYDNHSGISTFLFPKGFDRYMGDIEFLTKVNDPSASEYDYSGYEKHTFENGSVYERDGKLYEYKDGEFTLCCDAPEWELSFEKYLNRYNIGKVDCVSILLGANDLQLTSYEDSDRVIAGYIANARKMIEMIHSYDKNIAVVINLPVIGAEAYSWGSQLCCRGSSKMYRFNIIRACHALLERWESSEAENIYISPMLLCIDPENGFPRASYKVNRYSENIETHQSNWVHPNRAGYCQMGDALCGTLQKIRHK